jgi:hypothetical protein
LFAAYPIISNRPRFACRDAHGAVEDDPPAHAPHPQRHELHADGQHQPAGMHADERCDDLVAVDLTQAAAR